MTITHYGLGREIQITDMGNGRFCFETDRDESGYVTAASIDDAVQEIKKQIGEKLMDERMISVKGALAWHYSIPGDVLMDIAKERQRQNEKWGEQNHDAYRWLAILAEEVGEAAQAALHNEFGGHAKLTLRKELVQVAAVAVQWLECIDRNRSER